MKAITLFCATVLGLITLTGCQTSGAKVSKFDARFADTHPSGVTIDRKLDPSLLSPSTDLFTLGPGDEIEVELANSKDSRTALTVGPDGKIYFNLLPGVDVWGLTIAQAKARLEKDLEKYMSMPQVSMTLRTVASKQIWILGKVTRPGVYPIAAPMTLLEAMSLAGGTARSSSQVTTVDLADLRHAFVIRAGQSLPVDFHRLLVEGDMSQNLYLQPDDFIYVPSGAAREVYVFGAVKIPRSVPLGDQTTLVSAIASANGPIKDAYLSHVSIVRGSLSTPQITVVDYKAIIKGQATDIKLEPHDIVYVPYTPYRVLARYLDTILGTFVNTVAANEGVNLFSGNRVGVSVPVGGP